MGRKSKLSLTQWAEVERRLVAGEKIAPLAREFKLTEAAIRQRKSSPVAKIKSVANQIVTTTLALRELPLASQTSAQNFAARLLAMQDNVLGAASFGAANAHRLHGIANGIVQRIDDAEPLTEASMEAAKIVAALTKLGNDAALIPLGLLAANKERVINSDPDAKRKPLTINDFYGEDVA